MPLATDSDVLSIFSGGQFSDEPVEDEVLACFTDGQFGSELAAAIVVPPRPARGVSFGGGGGGGSLWIGGWNPPLTQSSRQTELVPCSVDLQEANYRPWVPPWEPLPPPPPPPPPPQQYEYVQYAPLTPDQFAPPDTLSGVPVRRELPWKAIAFGAVGILIGIVLAKTMLKEPK